MPPRLSAAQLEARRLADEFVPEAIELLKGIARTGPLSARLEAVKQLLDRSLGRPETRAEIVHENTADERKARAFALELVRAHPEIAARLFEPALPAGDVVDVTAKEPSE